MRVAPGKLVKLRQVLNYRADIIVPKEAKLIYLPKLFGFLIIKIVSKKTSKPEKYMSAMLIFTLSNLVILFWFWSIYTGVIASKDIQGDSLKRSRVSFSTKTTELILETVKVTVMMICHFTSESFLFFYNCCNHFIFCIFY